MSNLARFCVSFLFHAERFMKRSSMEVEGEGGGCVENERAERERAEGRLVVRAAQCPFWTERVGLGSDREYPLRISSDPKPRARGGGVSWPNACKPGFWPGNQRDIIETLRENAT